MQEGMPATAADHEWRGNNALQEVPRGVTEGEQGMSHRYASHFSPAPPRLNGEGWRSGWVSGIIRLPRNGGNNQTKAGGQPSGSAVRL